MQCPVIDHLACKIPGTLEPRIYDVFKRVTIAASSFFPNQFVEIGNRDAAWHLASIGWRENGGPSLVSIRLYNSRGSGTSDGLIRIGQLAGGRNGARPVNPSYAWPVNSSLMFDLFNDSVGSSTFDLFFYGFKIFDRGKAPC